jgi:hypothetical protein
MKSSIPPLPTRNARTVFQVRSYRYPAYERYGLEPGPSGCTLSSRDIRSLLSLSAELPSLIAFIAYVEAFTHGSPLRDFAGVIAILLRRLGGFNALALLPETLRLFQRTVEREMASQTPPTFGELNTAYLPILRALGSFFHRNALGDARDTRLIHPVVHQHVKVLFTTLDRQLQSLPSTSDPETPRNKRQIISKEILELLFTRPYLTMESSAILMRYCKNNGMKRSSWVWWRCCTVALEGGQRRAAEHYSAEAKKEAKREAKAREHSSEEESDVVGLRSASAIRKELGEEGWSAAVGQDLGRLARSGSGKRLQDVMATLEPRLQDPSNLTSSHAWSRLLNAARHDRSVNATTLLALRRSISEASANSHTLTPVMLGLLEKGEIAAAWDTWQELVNRHQSDPTNEAKRIDRVALAVGTLVCHAHHGLETAISLVDAWAYRSHISAADTASGKIKLDAHNVNILLYLCRTDEQPTVAFRLFAAALPRWGVYTDDISLTLLLDTARHASWDKEEDVPDIKHRLRQLADEWRFRRSPNRQSARLSGDFGAYDDSGFARGSTSVLLDQAVSRDNAIEPPWSQARELFYTIALSNWPWLADVPSPLDFHNGPYAHMVRDLTSLFRTRAPQSRYSKTTTSLRLPSPDTARYTHLVPSANTFHSYVRLLGGYSLIDEIPRALAWMRSLNITPKKETMILALMYVQDVEGPRKIFSDWENGSSCLVSDGDVLRRWLQEWLARGVPTEEDVAAHIRSRMKE